MNLRLKALAKMVDSDSRIADIGTDHAYLPIELIKTGKIKYAIASDIAKGPLLNAKSDIREAGFEKEIDIRLGAGLETVSHDDHIDTVVIAGMGGKLMTEILNDAWIKGFSFTTLILEPNIGELNVRRWLMKHNYLITEEHIIEEAGHIYELIKASLTDAEVELTDEELFFGPFLLKEKTPIFYQKWTNQLKYFENLLINLQKAREPDEARIKTIKKNILMIGEQIYDKS